MTVQILHGDCIEVMKTLPDDSVDCVVTSPPYWGLRDYGVDGQMGMERSLGLHLEAMVNVFREVRRILKPTGTLWLNYGDCYASTPNGRKAEDVVGTVGAIYDPEYPARTIGKTGSKHVKSSAVQKKGRVLSGGYLKPKDLCMIPNRLAIALQEDGWWVRSEIIWAKPNPMPESIRDRPATSHEKIFMLSKSGKYFFNAAGVKQPMAAASYERLAQDIDNQKGSSRANGGGKTNGTMKAVGNKQDGHGRRHAGFNERYAKGNAKTFRGGNYAGGKLGSRDSHGNTPNETGLRNLRNYEPPPMQIWEMATQPFSGAHFATFPPELVERCLKAGCPGGGIVFDPFGGAGTTGLAAADMGFDAILVELNQEYIDIAQKRIRSGLHKVSTSVPEKRDSLPLFSGEFV